MEFRYRVASALLGLSMALAPTASSAQGVVKLGMVGEFSGPFAQYGQQILGGMKAYMKVNGDTVAGKKIEIVQKDTTGPAPEIAKRHAQELVTRDNVDILVGFGLTPNALAAAPVATEAKKLMVIMNAATSIITTKSPYIVRVSMTLPQVTQPMAVWAAKNGIKKVYTVVADYGPGLDAEKAFSEAFKAAGGEMVGSIHTPLQNPDFGPFVQRVKDAKPEAVFLFLPAGEQGIAFMKGYEERGLEAGGDQAYRHGRHHRRRRSGGDGGPDAGAHYQLPLLGGAQFAGERCVQEGVQRGQRRQAAPEFHGRGRLRRHGGDLRGVEENRRFHRRRQVIAAIKGMKLASPRGPIMIDPETRDVVQTVYIRKVEKVGGGLYNVEFDKFADQKDPAK